MERRGGILEGQEGEGEEGIEGTEDDIWIENEKRTYNSDKRMYVHRFI